MLDGLNLARVGCNLLVIEIDGQIGQRGRGRGRRYGHGTRLREQ